MTDIVTKLCALKTGEELIYYTGELARDCEITNPESVKDEIKLIRSTAKDLSDKSRVWLFQKRCKPFSPHDHDFEYYAKGL